MLRPLEGWIVTFKMFLIMVVHELINNTTENPISIMVWDEQMSLYKINWVIGYCVHDLTLLLRIMRISRSSLEINKKRKDT